MAQEDGDEPVSMDARYAVEGEDAISTNFAAQAVLLYGASDNRTLQLNEASAFGELPYYADYVIAPPEAGRYTIWYGGSIPGARDPLAASYGSPIEISVNGNEPRLLYWEDVAVGEVYSPPYSWVRTISVELTADTHSLRITVPEPRRYDDRYFFYLDRILLLPEGMSPPGVQELREEPESIEDYLISLKEDPTDIEAYGRLIFYYTLLGDHLNAIRYANRALSVTAGDPAILQLLARNTIWNGDISGGLNVYWRLLSAVPSNLAGYLEAGKIAAWNGFYGASEQYYQAGIRNVENDLPLIANLGFTYLWWARENDARQQFRQAERMADTPERILQLGEIYERNEAFQRAEQVYLTGIQDFPDYGPLYIRLIELLYRHNRVDEVADIRATAPSEAIPALERLQMRLEERRELIAEYQDAAAENPLDVARRRVLAQTLFWNGEVERGVEEYENILAVEVSSRLVTFARERSALLEAAGLTVAVSSEVRSILSQVGELFELLEERLEEYLDAVEGGDDDVAARQEALATLLGEAERVRSVSGRLQRLYESASPELDGAVVEEVEVLLEQRDALASQIGSVELLSGIEEEVERSEELGFRRGGITGAELDLLQDPYAQLPEDAFAPEEVLVPEDRFYQLLHLLTVDVAAASELMERLVSTVSDEVPPLRQRLVSFFGLVQEEVRPVAVTPSTAVEEVDRLRGALRQSEEQLALLRQQVTQRQTSLFRRLQLRSEMALIEVEQGRLSFRTQLGNLFSDAGDVGRAIEQYERVLAFDESNLEARYALANLYRRDGRWAVAKEQLREIHRVDPGYRNTVGLYNEIAAANADTLVTRLFTDAESQRSAIGAELTYAWQINSRTALETSVTLRADRLRFEDVGQIRRHAYQVGDFSLGVPIALRDGRFTVRPELGVSTVANGLYVASVPNAPVNAAVDGADYFQNYTVRPVAGVRGTVTSGSLYASGIYRYAPYQAEFQLPERSSAADFEDVRSHGVDADVVWEPRESPSVFLQRLRLESSGEYDLLAQDGSVLGSRYLLQQGALVALLQRASPFTMVGVELSGSWEDYTGDETEVYTPREILQVGGALQARMYRPLREELTYGVNGRIYGGYYQPSLLEGDVDGAARVQLELGTELTRRNVAFQLNGLYNTTLRELSNPDYYSLQIELLAVVRNFDVLSR
jgi:tetratricopeptide (TPR) repeat protein